MGSSGNQFQERKPGEKKPLIWTATVRVLGHDSALLGMEAAATSGSARESAMPGVGDVLKGLFGR